MCHVECRAPPATGSRSLRPLQPRIKEIALRRSGTYTEVNAILYWATPKLLAVRRVTVVMWCVLGVWVRPSRPGSGPFHVLLLAGWSRAHAP